MKSECGLSTPALLAGIGDVRIRQRMEACQQGIIQLDSLRQKHTRLMEQLRSQYPDFATPPTRSTSTTTTTIENLHAHYSKTLPPITESPPTQHRYESTTLPQPSSSSSFINSSTSTSPPSTSLPTAMNAAFATRCESPISACMSSHRSSVSIDSGYTSISSDPFLSTISATPMSYSAFRKKASTLERPPHTSTTTTTDSPTTCTNQTSQQEQQKKDDEDEKEIESTSEKMIETTIESTTGTAPMRQNRFGRKQREDSSWQRPRSMFAMISTSTSNNNNNNEEEEEKNNVGGDNIKDKEKESFANVSVASTARKLLDTSTFSQITPPPMSRKFATLQKTPPKPLPRSIYPSSQQSPLQPPSVRNLSASSSALHEQQQHSSTISTTRTGFASRPPPQFAKFDSPIQLQNAKVYAPIQNSPKLAQSSTSAFTAAASKNSLKPGSTPPTKPRGNISCPIQSQHQKQQQSRTFIVPILASAKEIIPPRHHRIGIANNNNPATNEPAAMPSLHSAQPASAVLSRQQSYDTNSTNSPLEIRKMFFSTPHTITRYGGGGTSSSTSSSSSSTINGQNVNRYTFEKSTPSSQHHHQQQQCFATHLQSSSTPRNRREKIWHESEGL